MKKMTIVCDICGKETTSFFSTFEHTLMSSRSPISIGVGLSRVFIGSEIGMVGQDQPDLCRSCTIEALRGLLSMAESKR